MIFHLFHLALSETPSGAIRSTSSRCDKLLTALIERRQRLKALSQHVGLEMPPSIFELVARMSPRWHREHLIQFFERESFGLWNEQQDEDPSDQAPSCIPAEGTLGFESGE